MDVELVLGAREGRVDGEGEVLGRKGRMGQSLDQPRGVPGGLKVVGRVGGEDLRVLDAGDAGRGDQEDLGGADDVLEQSVAGGLVVCEAGNVLGGGAALVVNNGPEDVRIGGAAERGMRAVEAEEEDEGGCERAGRHAWGMALRAAAGQVAQQ